MLKAIAIYAPLSGSGKSTTAEYLERRYGYTRLKLSSTFKMMINALYLDIGMNPEEAAAHIEGKDKDTPLCIIGGRTTRDLQILMGQDWFRSLNQNIWIDITIGKIVTLKRRFVIDDLRQTNEYYRIAELAPVTSLWKIVRPEQHCSRHAIDGLLDGSEFGFHHTIHNIGSVNDLYATIDQIMR